MNALNSKGYLSRNWASAVQQFRDVFLLGNGVFFASGSMGIFWTIFAIQQTVDFGLFAIGKSLPAREGSEADRLGDQTAGFKEAALAAISPFVTIGRLFTLPFRRKGDDS